MGSAAERRSRPPPRWWGVTTTVGSAAKRQRRRRSGGEESSPPGGSAHDPGRCFRSSRWRSACPCPTCGGAESAPPWASPRRTGTVGTPVVKSHRHRRGRRRRLGATGGTTALPSRGADRPTPGGPTSGPTPTRRARGCGKISCRRWWRGCVTGNVRGRYPVRTPYAPRTHPVRTLCGRIIAGQGAYGDSSRNFPIGDLTLFSTGPGLRWPARAARSSPYAGLPLL